jgi:uncharacterized protein (DUF433 family)
MELNEIVTIDKDINNGKPVFKGTQVPVHSLFCHLQEGLTVESFIQLFPEVQKSQVDLLLKLTGKIFSRETLPG